MFNFKGKIFAYILALIVVSLALSDLRASAQEAGEQVWSDKVIVISQTGMEKVLSPEKHIETTAVLRTTDNKRESIERRVLIVRNLSVVPSTTLSKIGKEGSDIILKCDIKMISEDIADVHFRHVTVQGDSGNILFDQEISSDMRFLRSQFPDASGAFETAWETLQDKTSTAE